MPDDPKKDEPKPDPKKDEPKNDPDDLGEGGKKALDDERKARREAEKQLKAVNDRLKELEDKDKSDSEKLTGKVAELEKDLAEANARAMRYEVALDKGLTKTQARRLVGDSEEDLTTDADDLLASFKPSDDKKPAPTGGPKERLRPGTVPDAEPEETDPRKLAESVPRT